MRKMMNSENKAKIREALKSALLMLTNYLRYARTTNSKEAPMVTNRIADIREAIALLDAEPSLEPIGPELEDDPTYGWIPKLSGNSGELVQNPSSEAMDIVSQIRRIDCMPAPILALTNVEAARLIEVYAKLPKTIPIEMLEAAYSAGYEAAFNPNGPAGNYDHAKNASRYGYTVKE